MDYEEIVEVIGQASGGLSSEAAERAAQATLRDAGRASPGREAPHIFARAAR
jgi:hypothetical protein